MLLRGAVLTERNQIQATVLRVHLYETSGKGKNAVMEMEAVDC